MTELPFDSTELAVWISTPDVGERDDINRPARISRFRGGEYYVRVTKAYTDIHVRSTSSRPFDVPHLREISRARAKSSSDCARRVIAAVVPFAARIRSRLEDEHSDAVCTRFRGHSWPSRGEHILARFQRVTQGRPGAHAAAVRDGNHLTDHSSCESRRDPFLSSSLRHLRSLVLRFSPCRELASSPRHRRLRLLPQPVLFPPAPRKGMHSQIPTIPYVLAH